jgi:tryptophan synthase alpha chain
MSETGRIARRFAELRGRNEKALVAFVTAGDPLPEGTAEVVLALAEAGADVVELGIPFSDPLADGPTIQASSQRALDAGMTPPKVLEIVRQVRERSDVPLVLMGAWNPVLQYGIERFAADAVLKEEAGVWKRVCDAAGLDTIFLLAPTSTTARMALVGKMASGFVYCVSRTGITGARDDVPADLPPLVEAIRARAEGTPVCVGFGIAKPEQAAAIARFADGVVVGSRIVDLLHRERENPRMLDTLRDFIRALKSATAAPGQ